MSATPTSPQLPPPVLPVASDGGGRHETFTHTVPRPLREAIGLDALAVAAVAEVLRAWADAPEFSLGLVRADGAWLTVPARRTDDAFAARVAETGRLLGRPLAAFAPGDLPVVVSTGNVPGSQASAVHAIDIIDDPSGHRLEVRWAMAPGALPSGLGATIFAALVDLLTRLTDAGTWSERRPVTLPEGDRALVARVNDTSAAVPDVLLQEIVAQRAAEDPAAEAVVDGRRRLTYGELVAYANRIGRTLRRGGIGRGDTVAIVTTKGWEQYAAVYGVLSAGAAYLPVDAASPPQRLARLLRSGQVSHVLTQSGLADVLTWPSEVHLHRVDADFEAGDAGPLEAAQDPTDPAYVLFTSGSTGEPKGVVVDHRGVVNLVRDVNQRFAVGAHDRVFAVSALHFDASVYDVFGILAAGGTAVLPDPFDRAEPDRWTERVAAERVTFWNSVPAILELVVGQAEVRDDRPLASIRLAVVSGDWIPLTLPDRFRAVTAGAQIVGSGGPTETICWSVFSPIGTVDAAWRSIPYGKPITNQRYLIVDDELRQRPVWATGEMAVVSTIGLAHGYFADPERTAATFVALPETGERAYLTGDLGRWLPDGDIEILGRQDFQVKIQGHRIELGEIEAALRALAGVSAAVVVAPQNGRGGRRLAAYVVGEAELDAEVLRAGLFAALPRTMVPATITVLEALPLTGNGKVDRLTLGQHAAGILTSIAPAKLAEKAAETAAAAAATPGTALERLLCERFSDVLGLPPVGRGDNFFRLGGDSVSGSQLARELSGILGVAVPMRSVFEHPVPADLAAVIAGGAAGATAVEAAELYEAFRREVAG